MPWLVFCPPKNPAPGAVPIWVPPNKEFCWGGCCGWAFCDPKPENRFEDCCPEAPKSPGAPRFPWFPNPLVLVPPNKDDCGLVCAGWFGCPNKEVPVFCCCGWAPNNPLAKNIKFSIIDKNIIIQFLSDYLILLGCAPNNPVPWVGLVWDCPNNPPACWFGWFGCWLPRTYFLIKKYT